MVLTVNEIKFMFDPWMTMNRVFFQMVRIPLKQLVLNPSRGLSTIVIGSAANSVYFTFGQFPTFMLMPNFFHLNFFAIR